MFVLKVMRFLTRLQIKFKSKLKENDMRKCLSVMSAVVCLFWITGCSSVEKKADKCPEVDKAKQAKAAADAADMAKRKELAEKLIPTLKIGDSVSRFFEQIKKNQMDMLSRQLRNKQLQNPEEINNAVMTLMNKEMSWDNLKAPFVNLYAESFSAEELDALVKFYESPIGKKLVDKQPEIQQKSMALTRKLVSDITMKVHALTKELMDKQQAAKAKDATPAKTPVTTPETPAQTQPLPIPAAPGAKNVIPLK